MGGSLPASSITFNATSAPGPVFDFSLADTIPNTSQNISADPAAGYDIAWTKCYNDTTCHATAAKTLGNTTDISHNQIRALGNMSANPYADVRFYYCPRFAQPYNSFLKNWGRANAAL
jgi:hypothetical protein